MGCEHSAEGVRQRGPNLASAKASAAQVAAARLAASVVQAGRSAARAARARPDDSLRSSCSKSSLTSRNCAANIAAASAALRAVECVDAFQLEVDDAASLQELAVPKPSPEANPSCSCSCSPESDHVSYDIEHNVSDLNMQQLVASTSSQCPISPREREAVATVSTTTDEAVEIWDVVVDKTFIDVVLRRRVLPHTKSAPGRLRRPSTHLQKNIDSCNQVMASETVMAPENVQLGAAGYMEKQPVSEALDESETCDVWDVVVNKTFKSVVPKRPHSTLAHTASAPECLATSQEARRPMCDHRRSASRRRRVQQICPSRGHGRSQKPQASACRRVGRLLESG